VVESWLENDGDLATQGEAAARAGVAGEGRALRAEVGGVPILLLRGKRALEATPGCGGAAILVTDQRLEEGRPCLVLDAGLLGVAGAVAGWATPEGLRLVSSEAVAGRRPWTASGWEGEVPALPTLAPGDGAP
jgi:competence protein ComEC